MTDPIHASPRQTIKETALPFLTSLSVHATIVVIGILAYRAAGLILTPKIEAQVTPALTDTIVQNTDVVDQKPRLDSSYYNPKEDFELAATSTFDKRDTVLASASVGESTDVAGTALIAIAPGRLFPKGDGPLGKDGGGVGGPRAGFGTGDTGGSGIFRCSIGRAPKSVAYVCDASGSMINHFEQLRSHLTRSVNALKPTHGFNVMFFQESQAASASKNGLLLALPANKRLAGQFLDNVAAQGTTDPIPALEMALRQKPELLWLLTDGDFPNNAAVLACIRKFNSEKQTRINTIAFVNNDENYVALLKTIATEHGGMFSYVDEETLRK